MTIVALMAMENKMENNKIYRLWWKDQSSQDVFYPKEVTEMARKYSFDAEELLLQGEITFLDYDGDIVGGVTTDYF